MSTPDSPSERRPQLVILDRDGVINHLEVENSYVETPEQLQLIPGSAAAIARLNQAGFMVAVATNQRGIALGKYTENDLEQIHGYMQQLLSTHHAHIDYITYCPHNRDCCSCRKPLPGLIHQICKKFSISPQDCLLIGDSLSDIQAARRAQCKQCYLVHTGYGKRTQMQIQTDYPTWNIPNFCDLEAAVSFLLTATSPTSQQRDPVGELA